MGITEEDRIVARNIKRLRERYGLDRRELEEKAGIAFGILDQIETFHKPAGKSIRKRLVEYFGCPYAELYCQPEMAAGKVGAHEPQAEYESPRSPAMREYTKKLTEILNSGNKQAIAVIKANIDTLHRFCQRK